MQILISYRRTTPAQKQHSRLPIANRAMRARRRPRSRQRVKDDRRDNHELVTTHEARLRECECSISIAQ
jgi:hypothetical protein